MLSSYYLCKYRAFIHKHFKQLPNQTQIWELISFSNKLCFIVEGLVRDQFLISFLPLSFTPQNFLQHLYTNIHMEYWHDFSINCLPLDHMQLQFICVTRVTIHNRAFVIPQLTDSAILHLKTYSFYLFVMCE